MKEIAIYGGTFDPPTRAHVAIIEACLADSSVDEVWVMPSGRRDDKPEMETNNHRLEMLRTIKTEDFHNTRSLRITDFEIRLPHPTETISTLNALEETYPHHQFHFVFGADSYEDMPKWREGSYLQRKLGLLLVQRSGYSLPREGENIRHLKTESKQYESLSSTEARNAIRNGNTSLKYLTPGVLKYVAKHSLYQ